MKKDITLGDLLVITIKIFFFNFKSVYGQVPEVGDTVCYACFPGEGADRAHPVILIKNNQI